MLLIKGTGWRKCMVLRDAGGKLAAKYYTRPRKVEDPKKWRGPFDASQLKEQAERRLFSKELHEYSEDRVNWISARQIWPELFPKKSPPLIRKQDARQADALQFQAAAVVQQVDEPAELVLELDETPDWYCACDGVQHGPFTATQLRELVAREQLQPTDLIWSPTLGDNWIEAQSDPNLFPTSTFDSGRSNSTVRSSGGDSKVPPSAIASFILAFVPLIGSVLAIAFGQYCLSQMQRGRFPKSGKWMAIAGLSIGYATLIILFLTIAVVIALR